MINIQIAEDEMNNLKYLLQNEHFFLFDKEFVRKFNTDAREFILANDFHLFKICSPQLNNDKELVLEIIQSYIWSFKSLNEKMRDDKEIAQIALNIRPGLFPYLSERLRDDDEIVDFALKYSPKFIRYTSDRFKNNKDFVLNLIKTEPALISDIHEELKNDIDVLLQVWNQIKPINDHMKFRQKVGVLLSTMNEDIKSFFNLVNQDDVSYEVVKQMDYSFDRLILTNELNNDLNSLEKKQIKRSKL